MKAKVTRLVLIGGLLMLAGCSKKAIVTAPNNTTSEIAQIEFSSPMTADDALRLTSGQSLQVLEVRHSYDIGGSRYRGFLAVTTDRPDAQGIRNSLAEAYATFVSDVAGSSGQSGAEPAIDRASAQNHKRLLAAFRNTSVSGPPAALMIDGLMVRGGVAALQTLTKNPSVSSVSMAPITSSEDARVKSGAEPSSATSTQDWTGYTPRSGSVDINPSAPGTRYVLLGMMWNNTSSFTYFSTYEHVFSLNNDPASSLGRGTYLDRGEYTDWNYRGIPRVIYASSNLPRAFLDTRYGDPQNIKVYTIGSADADAIQTGTWYQNYIRTWNGDANVDNAELSAKIGNRRPPNNFSTWASWGIESRWIYGPNWPIRVPNGFSWSK